jgi:GAF domain-containing protein
MNSPRARSERCNWVIALHLQSPLVRAVEAIGVIFIRRAEARPFSKRQIELVNTFADQAVIAIENSRLFEKVQARTRQLANTVEDWAQKFSVSVSLRAVFVAGRDL